MRINKFNIGWQIVRLKAKKAKGLDLKLSIVGKYLKENRNIHDRGRVKNWLTVMKIHYQDNFEFEELQDLVENGEFVENDNSSYFSDYPKDILIQVLKDIEKRKRNFMYNGTPKSHTNFVFSLKQYLLTV